MKPDDLDFTLPDDLIAAIPLVERDASRMLVLDRRVATFADSEFAAFIDRLNASDVLVLNDTKVFPARLFGRTENGSNIEVFLVRELGADLWEVLARPGRRLRTGKRLDFDGKLSAEVIEKLSDGKVVLRFPADGDLYAILDEIGKTPLPPYIKRKIDSPDSDRERYQTVYAKHRGAIAAPTAGLHFTPELIADIEKKGIRIVNITLHVGYGTFEPIRVDDISEHKVLPEHYHISEDAAEMLNYAQAAGDRIVAVGTTTTRALESALVAGSKFSAGPGVAELTITPGYQFRAVNALLTNFHLPKSSLLLLVSTFAGRDLIMEAYRHAVSERYRFYSYGDCMFIE